MNKNDVFLIMKAIASDPFFKDYKVRKSDNVVINKTEWGWFRIEPDYYNTYDLNRKELALEIMPLYEIRFNVLHKWFEKYSKKKMDDQRDNCSIIVGGEDFGETNEFYFLENRIDYENDLKKFVREVTTTSKKIFSRFASLEDYYNFYIAGVLEGKRNLPDEGFDWVIEYLIATRLVEPSSYGIVKNLVLKQIEFMKGRNNPNILLYYDELPMILEDLESTDFNIDK